MPIASKWDGSCKVCNRKWKAGTQIEKQNAGHWCLSEGSCVAGQQQQTQQQPQIQATPIPAMDAPNAQRVRIITTQVMQIYQITKDEVGKYKPNPDPAFIGMIMKMVVDKLEAEE